MKPETSDGFNVQINPDQFGTTYVGPVYMGAQAQKLHVVFDTGSDWLVLEGDKCKECQGDTFNGNISGVKLSEEPKERKYGSVILVGDEYEDRVCLDKTNPETCLNKFKYYLVGQSKKRGSYRGMVEPVDGLMGMSRPELPDHLHNKKKLAKPIPY